MSAEMHTDRNRNTKEPIAQAVRYPDAIRDARACEAPAIACANVTGTHGGHTRAAKPIKRLAQEKARVSRGGTRGKRPRPGAHRGENVGRVAQRAPGWVKFSEKQTT